MAGVKFVATFSKGEETSVPADSEVVVDKATEAASGSPMCSATPPTNTTATGTIPVSAEKESATNGTRTGAGAGAVGFVSGRATPKWASGAASPLPLRLRLFLDVQLKHSVS